MFSELSLDCYLQIFKYLGLSDLFNVSLVDENFLKVPREKPSLKSFHFETF